MAVWNALQKSPDLTDYLPTTSKNTSQLRLRIFAGPNRSGKSTIIKAVRDSIVNGHPLDFGYYISVDDIVSQLTKKKFSFDGFKIKVTADELTAFARTSGLLSGNFTEQEFIQSFHIRSNKVFIKMPGKIDNVAQIIARFTGHFKKASKKKKWDKILPAQKASWFKKYYKPSKA